MVGIKNRWLSLSLREPDSKKKGERRGTEKNEKCKQLNLLFLFYLRRHQESPENAPLCDKLCDYWGKYTAELLFSFLNTSFPHYKNSSWQTLTHNQTHNQKIVLKNVLKNVWLYICSV